KTELHLGALVDRLVVGRGHSQQRENRFDRLDAEETLPALEVKDFPNVSVDGAVTLRVQSHWGISYRLCQDHQIFCRSAAAFPREMASVLDRVQPILPGTVGHGLYRSPGRPILSGTGNGYWSEP